MSNKLIVRGQRLKLDNYTKFNITHNYVDDKNFDADLYCFFVDSNYKINIKNVYFYNRAISKDKSLEYKEFTRDNLDYEELGLYLDLIPKNIKNITLGVKFYRSEQEKKIFTERNLKFEIQGSDGFSKIGEYYEKINTNHESLILGEVYLYKGKWKFKTILNKYTVNIKKVLVGEFKYSFIR